jgi:hypothetical protein
MLRTWPIQPPATDYAMIMTLNNEAAAERPYHWRRGRHRRRRWRGGGRRRQAIGQALGGWSPIERFVDTTDDGTFQIQGR